MASFIDQEEKDRTSERRLEMRHMNGGDGEMSYSKNSKIQRDVIARANSIREEAIIRLHNSIFQGDDRVIHLAMADLGCATGPNALLVARQLITTINRIGGSPECQVFLNDLPGNDFNAVFKALPKFYQELKGESNVGFGSCFVNAIPGSFYERLFPAKSMHFFHSSACLHWLSQVPKGIEWSKGRNEESLRAAYYEQFKHDFSTFLKCRSKELVSGGCMVLTIPTRYVDDCENPLGFQNLIDILIQMTSEGMIDTGKMDTFNVPMYKPSMEEIEKEIIKEASFAIDQYEQQHVVLEVFDDEESKHRAIGHNLKSARSVIEPLLLSHFGEGIPIDQVFQRFKTLILDHPNSDLMPKTRSIATISLTKHY